MRTQYWAMTAVVLLVWSCDAFAQRPRWVETHRWEGRGTRTTPLAHINGTKWRVRYRIADGKPLDLAVYRKDGRQLDRPVEPLRHPHGWLQFGPEKGYVYLHLAGGEAAWRVSVEQYLTTIEEWDLIQEFEAGMPPLRKYGIWFGNQTGAAYDIELPPTRWRLRARNRGTGPLQLRITDLAAPKQPVLTQVVAAEGTYETWVHRGGHFKLETNGAQAEWELAVDYEPHDQPQPAESPK